MPDVGPQLASVHFHIVAAGVSANGAIAAFSRGNLAGRRFLTELIGNLKQATLYLEAETADAEVPIGLLGDLKEQMALYLEILGVANKSAPRNLPGIAQAIYLNQGRLLALDPVYP